MPDEIRRKLPDDVVDELLAGARTEEEIVGPGGVLWSRWHRIVVIGLGTVWILDGLEVTVALGDNRDAKLFGISMASAVFLDAFVVRSLLLPSRRRNGTCVGNALREGVSTRGWFVGPFLGRATGSAPATSK